MYSIIMRENINAYKYENYMEHFDLRELVQPVQVYNFFVNDENTQKKNNITKNQKPRK